MKILWCDTETLGINPTTSYPFQIGLLFENIENGKSEVYKKVFEFDPFDIPNAVLEPESTQAHGFTESDIRAIATKSREAVLRIKSALENIVRFGDGSKPYFTAYNTYFDFKQIQRLFYFYGININSYVENMLDVYKQVKNARESGVLPTEIFNHYIDKEGCDKYSIKLVDIASYLNVEQTSAHNALSDIEATYGVSKILESKGVKLLDTAWQRRY